MLTLGDLVDLNLGPPERREAGFRHPAVVVTAKPILVARPTVIQAVPLTTTIRRFGSEVTVEPDHDNGLWQLSAARCQHVRAVSTDRVEQVRGNVGPTVISQIRETIALILDIPS